MTSRPLLFPLLGAVLGLSLAWFCDAALPVWGLASLLGLALVAVFTPARSLFVLLLFLSAFSWGAVALHHLLNPPVSPSSIAWYQSECSETVCGVIDERPERTETGCRVVVRAEWLADGARQMPVQGRILVYIRDGRTSLVTGDRVCFVSRLHRPRNYGLPGEMDFVRYLLLKGISVTAQLHHADGLVLVKGDAASHLSNRLDRLANRLGTFISVAVPGEEGGILRALLLGDRGDIPLQIEAAYSRSGVNHILSISGFHVAIVALAVYQLLFLFGRCSEALMLSCNLRRLAPLAGLPVIIVYLFLSGAAPATARSVIMILIGVLALTTCRESDPLNILIISALLLIGINPALVFDISFQFSFLAIWGLIVLTPLIMSPFRTWEGRPIGKILQLTAASVAAIGSTLVPVAYYFHRTSVVGVVANLFIVPLMGFGAVVIGCAALPLVILIPAVAGLLLECAGFLVFISDRIILILAQAPLLPYWSPSRFDLLISYLILLSLTFVQSLKRKAAAAAVLMAVLAAGHSFHSRNHPPGLGLVFFSLGQAESSLIRFPTGQYMLVDGGGSIREGGSDTGERLLAPALRALGVDHLDVVVLSHDHPDHLRGLRFIIENFPVGQFWETGLQSDGSDYTLLRSALQLRRIPIVRLSGGTAPFLFGGARIEPLAPECSSGSTNDDSLVFRIVWRDQAVLFTGDIGSAAEAELLNRPELLRADVLKVPHHGSMYSSSDAFLDVVRPRIALISAGYGNSFHLPAAQTLGRLARRRCVVYRTDLHGTVFLNLSGDALTVNTVIP